MLPIDATHRPQNLIYVIYALNITVRCKIAIFEAVKCKISVFKALKWKGYSLLPPSLQMSNIRTVILAFLHHKPQEKLKFHHITVKF